MPNIVTRLVSTLWATYGDHLVKLFWTVLHVALGAAVVEVAEWEQGPVTLAVTGLIQLASSWVRAKVDRARSAVTVERAVLPPG